jgi:hypothetical protein
LTVPGDIDTGIFRGGWGAGAVSYDAPVIGINEEGPGNLGIYEDLSENGPGGWNFVYQKEENLIPWEEGLNIMRIPGPGEQGFSYIEQKNLVPVVKTQDKKKRIK